MSRASSERDAALTLLMEAAVGGKFAANEFQRMFFVAVQSMTVNQMETMLKECTSYEDLADLEFSM